MGFLDTLNSLLQGALDKAAAQQGLTRDELRANREIIDMADTLYDGIGDERNYRKIALENTPSNHGWYTCPKCGRKFRASGMDADHIVPQSKGGDASCYNLQMLCSHCNRAKKDDTSETAADLRRRRNEIEQQRQDDYTYLNNLTREMKKKK